MTQHKIGRNDPCPCGSGKKYKQCCQVNDSTRNAPARLPPEALAKAMQAAWINSQHGRLPQAEALCHQILQVRPNHADALHLLGAIALQDSNMPVAIGFLEKAVRLNPAHPEYLNNMGFALHEQGQLEAAEKYYRKAIALAPDYANAWFNLHALLLSRTELAPAIRCMQKAVELSPSDVEARFILGVLLDYSGDAASAAAHFNTVGKAGGLYRSRLDAWNYLKAANPSLPPMLGSNYQTFKLGFEAAPAVGLVLEFGVRHGTSIRQIAALAGQQVHGFDSFEGLPEVWHHEPKGSYTTKGEIPKVPDNVTLHAGWFDNTLPEFLKQHGEPVRFLNIDCDIYSSTKTVLDLLASQIVIGTVIVFDEYIGNEHWREDEFKAFQEAVTRNGWTYEYLCFSVFTKQVAVKISGQKPRL
jgi:tetratricopeptide (TPR) repeat protein